MLLSSFPVLSERRQAIVNAYCIDEKEHVANLMATIDHDPVTVEKITARATAWVEEIRQQRLNSHGVDAFLSLYTLSSEEGIALMCLAEALLRIPDKNTMDALIRDKLVSPDWRAHLGKSESFFVNAATWGLVFTGRFLSLDTPESSNTMWSSLKQFFGRSSEPVIRTSIEHAMRIMGKQFVMGETIDKALKRAQTHEKQGYRYSYDMLGEAARTADDATAYCVSYQQAIAAISKAANQRGPINGPGISVKLSALHPRYELAKRDDVLKKLVPSLLALAQQAKAANIAMTIDAEEADRLDLSLDIIEAVFLDASLSGWEGFGLAVQSYQKRAWFVLDWVADLAKRGGRRMMVRLIKGAYWDSEIKQAQMLGLDGFPVFTRKCHTDISFQACAKKLLGYRDSIYSQFATHNAYSAALILEYAGDYRDFEFQCLHGMGDELYNQIVPADALGIACRIYAPVGSHENLLPYLVRRLLENGANSSFVNQIVNADQPIEELVQAPVEKAHALWDKPLPIALPEAIYPQHRKNSVGLNLSNWSVLRSLKHDLDSWHKDSWPAVPDSDEQIIATALANAENAFSKWDARGAASRADCLRKAADLLEKNMPELMALAILEAGKTIPDAIGEIREAVDFCRYYAQIAEEQLVNPMAFTGYTGETNQLFHRGRGVMLCISPWNFPLAIFIGQVTACLVTGNTVIAKPAEQTPKMAARAVTLLHEAGIPEAVLQLLPGSGETVGAALTADLRIKGVLFTGSTETAQKIAQTLAHRSGPLVPFVAETGGLNAMIVDSSALLEQVTQDVLTSAFGSAGQRCSALRVLFVQRDVFAPLMRLLKGAMAELTVGDPAWLTTDIGPVIDKDAQVILQKHIQHMRETATFIAEASLDPAVAKTGHFVAPIAFEIPNLSTLKREVFGPVLHVIQYDRDALPNIIEQINTSGYGLTLGIHSRINETVDFIQSRARVGNCYVNRNMIGAVVGLQPFGGEGLSGTGPKAGGPHYLQRLCVERVLTINITAAGGNALLMSQKED